LQAGALSTFPPDDYLGANDSRLRNAAIDAINDSALAQALLD